MKDFQACAKNLQRHRDMPFAARFFSPLHGGQFPDCPLPRARWSTCLLIQALLIEASRSHAYHSTFPSPILLPASHEGVWKDEYTQSVNYGPGRLKANLEGQPG